MAIDNFSFPIMWSSEFARDLTDSDDIVAPRRGRPTGLTDDQLHDRRHQFVQIFEGAWFDIYRELQRCKKPDDLIRIFTPVPTPKLGGTSHSASSVVLPPNRRPAPFSARFELNCGLL